MNRLIQSDPERVRIATAARERVLEGMPAVAKNVVSDVVAEEASHLTLLDKPDTLTLQTTSPETIPRAS